MNALAAQLNDVRYWEAFTKERANKYPVVDTLEQRMGAKLDSDKLWQAARVLACPLKKNPPNWQHGRILYALTRNYCSYQQQAVNLLDIGTAKGFSALCLYWAMQDAGVGGTVTSVDVIDPNSRVSRNTVAEAEGLKTLAETLQPWPEAEKIDFRWGTGEHELASANTRINVCFIDGKHSGKVVATEGYLLSLRQMVGDLVMFDDVHIPDVWQAVKTLRTKYDVEKIELLPNRAYAIGVRRG